MNEIIDVIPGGAPATTRAAIPAMTDEAIERVRLVEAQDRQQPQIPFVTEHLLHKGIYTRTAPLPGGARGVGVLVKIPTTLHLFGDAEVFTGYETIRITGCAVLPAAAHRKQVFHVFSPWLFVSMSFATTAKTVEEAQAQFTDEIELLVPLTETDRHRIIITGD